MDDREWPNLRWCGEPPLLAAETMDDWLVMLRARGPWTDMVLDDVSGAFRAVLDALLQPGDARTPDQRAARLRRAARAHGAYRRRQGCPAIILAEETAIAEDAIAAALLRGGAPPAVAATIQHSMAPVMRAVERAMYSGYVDCGEPPESMR